MTRLDWKLRRRPSRLLRNHLLLLMITIDLRESRFKRLKKMPTLKLRLKKVNSLLYLIIILEEIPKRERAEVRN